MKPTTFVEEQTEAAIEANINDLREIEEAYEGAIDDTYELLEIGGVDISEISQEDEELIDRTIAEMVERA